MKSERRHELQHNELADQLAAFLEKLAPYTKGIMGCLLAVVVLALAYAIWTQQQIANVGKGWNDLFKVVAFNDPLRRDEDDVAIELEKVAQKHLGTSPGLWALLTEANLDLENGVKLLFTSREDATMHLERARTNFDRVAKESAGMPFLRQQALFGSGQASESLGDLTKAQEKYDLATKSNPESAVGKNAIAHSKTLADDDNRNFVEWFQRQKPKPFNPQSGFPGMPGMGGVPGRGSASGTGTGAVPPIKFDDLPQAPDINLPSNLGDLIPRNNGNKPDADAPEKKPDADDDSAKKPDADPAAKPADPPAEKPSSPDADAKGDGQKEPAAPPAGDAKKEEAPKDDAAPAKP